MTELSMAISAAAVIAVVLVFAVNFRDWRRAKAKLQISRAAVAKEPSLGLPLGRFGSSVLPTPGIDAIAMVSWVSPMSVARIDEALKGWRHVGTKPLSFGWLTTTDEPRVLGDQLQDMRLEPEASEVTGLAVGILMATRSGPIHAMEYAEWESQLGELAASLGGQLMKPSMNDVLAQGRALDQQCLAVDAQLSICVQSDEVLSHDAIHSAAENLGLETRGELRYARGPLSAQVFSVFPGDRGNQLILLLDLPRTPEPLRAFQEMRETAAALAQLLHSRVTDESGRDLLEADFDRIADQIKTREQMMMAMAVKPGSPQALRLFA
jgi:hypothetical protein